MMLFADMAVHGATGFLAGLALTWGAWWLWWRTRKLADQAEVSRLQEQGRRDVETLMREARVQAAEESFKSKQQQEEELRQRRMELDSTRSSLEEQGNRLQIREEELSRRSLELEERARSLQQLEADLQARSAELESLTQRRLAALEAASGLSAEDARRDLLQEVENQASRDASSLSRKILEDAKRQAEQEARRIISTAIQRYASDHTFETTTATVSLPGDEIKGRIIGRDGRNIRAFEAATGVTVLIDDTPHAVVLSGFDPIRREIARTAMELLIQDGRIHPTRIEEVVLKVNKDMDATIIKYGEDAVFRTGIPPLPPEVVEVLGRLRFRQSFSQNVLDHSVEVARLTGLMAAELGLDGTDARRTGLLHDIGKALSQEIEGPHALAGAEFLGRFNLPAEVIQGVASHHGEVPEVNIYGVLVSAADAISASRPGARSETMSTYIQRLADLERIGASYDGVEKCYAVQAGRELRVMVRPAMLDDEACNQLARKISRTIEEQLHYPGQIRVTVIRETRVIEVAK